jgi:hypothetical protein
MRAVPTTSSPQGCHSVAMLRQQYSRVVLTSNVTLVALLAYSEFALLTPSDHQFLNADGSRRNT